MGSEPDVSTRHLHVIGVSPRVSLGQRELNVVATQRTSNLSNAGSENHPIKKVAITIDTSCSYKEKVPTNMKFAVNTNLFLQKKEDSTNGGG